MAEVMCTDSAFVYARLLQVNGLKELYDLPPLKHYGVYCIFELINDSYVAIYVGMGYIKERIQSHLGGYDDKKIGKSLSRVDRSNIKISWKVVYKE
ncbi:hypothetical protein KUTeg_016579 [Tegillarca granosa]|uniref:GIY-YIG domain-containing protein n=1 Tax=Tegillarca granosa TaxID=220873 RepID=A0ABQ9EL81_TEGGR|nr:hypothetical protein KUTeg_016579 [Tegillarca granosa]